MEQTTTVQDYATGRELPWNHREAVRQEYERIIIDVLGYPREEVAIDFPISMNHGSETATADVVVFHSHAQEPENAHILVEVAPPGSSFPGQVPPYVTLTGAEFYVWFDGFIDLVSRGPFYYYRMPNVEPPQFQQRPTVPRKGESLVVKQRPRRRARVGNCPLCGADLEMYCPRPCDSRTCSRRKLVYCIECQKTFPRGSGLPARGKV